MEKETKTLKNKSISELQKALIDAKKKLEQIKLDLRTGKSAKTHEAKKEKKTVARILTVIREKQWAEFEKQEGAKDDNK